MSPEENALIELDVTIKEKHYSNSDNPVLAALDFHVKQGEFLAIIGPSGCGKTTLLNMISGLENCPDHAITCLHVDKNNTSLQLGYIFQQPRLMPWLTVRQNIELVLSKSEYYQVDSMLSQVGLANKGEYFPRQLSGGMQRRVSIARAFAIKPHLLLLDEPFNSLDAPTAGRLRQLLIDLCIKSGITVIFVTHDIQEAICLADRIIFLSGSPARIIHQSHVDIPRPRVEAGESELTFQTQLLTQFPHLLDGRVE